MSLRSNQPCIIWLRNHVFLSTSNALCDIFAWARTQTILILDRKVTQILIYFLFSIFSLQLLTFFWACFQLKNSWENLTKMRNSYQRVAKCSLGKFCSEFFTSILSISCIFPTQLTHHAGIIGKISSSYRT